MPRDYAEMMLLTSISNISSLKYINLRKIMYYLELEGEVNNLLAQMMKNLINNPFGFSLLCQSKYTIQQLISHNNQLKALSPNLKEELAINDMV